MPTCPVIGGGGGSRLVGGSADTDLSKDVVDGAATTFAASKATMMIEGTARADLKKNKHKNFPCIYAQSANAILEKSLVKKRNLPTEN